MVSADTSAPVVWVIRRSGLVERMTVLGRTKKTITLSVPVFSIYRENPPRPARFRLTGPHAIMVFDSELEAVEHMRLYFAEQARISRERAEEMRRNMLDTAKRYDEAERVYCARAKALRRAAAK